ncbi:unnamed protein product [Callosobruchus maculatus]|uniref:Uncharacterized protein n=1 Tax=Callosobruchus maculatus TaxID=64391 RepID=A0A653CMB9_CALMS|nr:unnamed protein product [Callosobruchus maculatus]
MAIEVDNRVKHQSKLSTAMVLKDITSSMEALVGSQLTRGTIIIIWMSSTPCCRTSALGTTLPLQII